MSHRRIGLVMIVAACACGSALMAQEAGRDDRGRDDRRRDDGDRGRGRDRDRGDFGRGGPPWGWGRGPGGPGGPGNFNPTPEQRERFYGEMVDRYMERLTDTYDLSPVQQMQVRQRLEQFKAQDNASAEQRRQKREQLWQQIQPQVEKLRERREAGEEVDRDEWRKAFEPMREVMPKLMDREVVVGDVEKLLPAAQVARGRERYEQEREEREREWRDRRERDRGRDRDGGRDDRGDRRDRDRDRDRGDRGRRSEGDWRDSWERYTDNFCRRYQLDASQQTSAQSILRDALDRRKQYEESHQADYAALQQIQDRDQRRQQSDTLNAPVAALFEELKTKLNQLPTSAQRLAVDPPPSSRPAADGGATSRPSRRDSDRGRGRDSYRDRDRGSDRGDRGSRDSGRRD